MIERANAERPQPAIPQPYGNDALGERQAAEGEAAEPTAYYRKSKEQLKKELRDAQRKMQKAAKEMDFIEAAKYRDQIKLIQQQLAV